MEDLFRFKEFSVHNSGVAMKVGTDGVLLGAVMSLDASSRELLDIGTGTGVVSLLAAQRLSELGADSFRITAIDIDGPSARVASLNFSESPWADKLRAVPESLEDFSAGSGAGVVFDSIFSNPPYYDESLGNEDRRVNAARHTGSLSYREICEFAADRLKCGGRLSLVLPSSCEKTLRRTAASYGLKASRIVRVRTTARKEPLRIVAEFVKTEALHVKTEALHVKAEAPHTKGEAQLVEEEIVLSEPNVTDKYYLYEKDYNHIDPAGGGAACSNGADA